MDRKTFLQLTGTAAASAYLPRALEVKAPTRKKRSIRIAYLTDVHIHPEGPSADAFAKALHQAQSLTPRPDIIFNGGDAVMDALKAGKSATRAQWDLFNRVLSRPLLLSTCTVTERQAMTG